MIAVLTPNTALDAAAAAEKEKLVKEEEEEEGDEDGGRLLVICSDEIAAEGVDAAGIIVAVSVLCVLGFEFCTSEQTSYTADSSLSLTSSHWEAKQSKAPSPMVKPDVLSLVHRQLKFGGGPQVEKGKFSAMKNSRQVWAQAGTL